MISFAFDYRQATRQDRRTLPFIVLGDASTMYGMSGNALLILTYSVNALSALTGINNLIFRLKSSKHRLNLSRVRHRFILKAVNATTTGEFHISYSCKNYTFQYGDVTQKVNTGSFMKFTFPSNGSGIYVILHI